MLHAMTAVAAESGAGRKSRPRHAPSAIKMTTQGTPGRISYGMPAFWHAILAITPDKPHSRTSKANPQSQLPKPAVNVNTRRKLVIIIPSRFFNSPAVYLIGPSFLPRFHSHHFIPGLPATRP